MSLKRKLTVLGGMLAVTVLNMGAAQAENVRLAVGVSIPPYFLFDEEDKGLQYDIIAESLAYHGHTLNVLATPNARSVAMYEAGQVDGVVNVLSGMVTYGFYTDTPIAYHNMIITLKDSNLNIEEVSDLRELSLLAFQNAHRVMGTEYSITTKNNPRYKEIVDQATQVLSLMHGRVDGIVANPIIISWILQHLINQGYPGLDKDLAYHPIFLPQEYAIAFKNKNIRDDFNDGLAQLHRSGRYQELINYYIPEAMTKEFSQ